MDFGLYEKLMASEIKNQISELHNETRKVDKSESARVLATAYYKILRKIVAATGERIIIVMGVIYVIKSRVSGTLTKYNSCIA